MSKSNNILVSFPTSGYIELPTGNTDVDFITGKALLSDGSVEELGNRIRRDSQLKSVLIISKKDINIKVSSNTKEDAYIGLVPTGALRLTNITFDHIRIITTEATDVFLVASMDPNGAEAGSVLTSIYKFASQAEASAHESITVTDSAVGLTAGTYGDATKANMTLETAPIRVWKDGTDPTSSEGHPVEVGDQINLYNAADIANFKAIRTGSTSGKLTVTYSE